MHPEGATQKHQKGSKGSVGELLDVGFATATEVGHVPARDPHRIADAARRAAQAFEFRVHHLASLRAADRRLQGLCIEAVNLGYRVVVPLDATVAVPPAAATGIVRSTLQQLATISTSAAVVEAWST